MMQRTMSQLDALELHRQANELFHSSYSMYSDVNINPSDWINTLAQYEKTAKLLESILPEYINEESRTLLAKTYWQTLYALQQILDSSQPSRQRTGLYKKITLCANKLNSLLTNNNTLSTTNKHLQLLMCQLQTTAKPKKKGYTQQVLNAAAELNTYYPVDEHHVFLQALTKEERMNLVWCTMTIAIMLNKADRTIEAKKYSSFANQVKLLVVPTLIEFEPVLTQNAKQALYRERAVGKREQEFVEDFIGFVGAAHEEAAVNGKKLKSGS